MTEYLRNAWYAACWSADLDATDRLARCFLDEPVALFRTSTRAPVALADRCPHRFAPLSLGKRDGDVLVCPYHGLRFDAAGACVVNPHGNGRIPPGARVQTYPLVERHSLVWIWMGHEPADEAQIPDLAFLVDPALQVRSGDALLLHCNYELATDNLMDLSHAVFVHEGSFGTPDVLRGEFKVVQDGASVSANYWVPDCRPVGSAFPVAGPGQPVDHWLEVTWRPAGNLTLKVGATPPGQPRDAGAEALTAHLLTPESATTTHYLFATARSGRFPAPVPGAPALPSQKAVFETEDEPILREVQQRMGNRPLEDLDPVFLPGDAGGLRVRRLLRGLIGAEGRQASLQPQAESGAPL